ncbi:MAG: dinitrogenase iron-molybdenum cofactor biosynthesis protein [Tissierellia bacterium]|nr:dinitrogenase iron-molybdenum cofactor biosynthesis protein [Tissierellia bacterium]
MRIAIPVDKKDNVTKVSTSFGRASYFIIYDIESKESSFIENKAKESKGGAGIVAAQTIVDNKVDVLLTPQCGENAAEVIKAADIKIYKTEGTDLEKNLDNFTHDKLSLLDEIHSGYHGHKGD